MFELYEAAATVADVRGRRRLVFDDEADYRRAIGQMAAGLRLTVRIEEEQDARPKSDKQRGYWFAVPVPLCADHCGNTDKQMSRDMMAECFGYEVNRFGKQVPIESSFAALTVTKAKELIDWMLDWAPRELGVIVPPPDKDWKKHAEAIRRERMRLRVHAALEAVEPA
jgi:hypothetical protein